MTKKKAQSPLTPLQNDESAFPVLSLRPTKAAKALDISERLLWSKTNAGEIPCVRIGSAVLYPVDLLREYLNRQAKGGRP